MKGPVKGWAEVWKFSCPVMKFRVGLEWKGWVREITVFHYSLWYFFLFWRNIKYLMIINIEFEVIFIFIFNMWANIYKLKNYRSIFIIMYLKHYRSWKLSIFTTKLHLNFKGFWSYIIHTKIFQQIKINKVHTTIPLFDLHLGCAKTCQNCETTARI